VETAKLQTLAAELQDIENHLPIDPRQRNPKLGALAPITVVNEIYASGDGNRGVQTAAFNLPNDERIGKEIGTKRTLLKNVQEAKFAKVLLPISRIALAPADRGAVSFDAFFTHILMHELMHGLGPHHVSAPDGKATTTTVRAALQDDYGALEEAKADIAGLWALQFLIDRGTLPAALERNVYVTFLASAFRTLRFGGDAHAIGMALQVNTLLDAGGFRVAADGRFSVDRARIKDAVRALAAEIMTVQAAGDRAKAAEMVRGRARPRPEVTAILGRMGKIPVDIDPSFPTAARLVADRP
jgi:hypothetical protein